MSSTLLFIRHAETDLAGRFCGHSDPPINDRGRQQIEELLKALCVESIDGIYVSDLKRALETAEAIAGRFQLAPIAVPELREIYFGEWEGLSWSEIEDRDAALARRWAELYPRLAAPGGESFDEFRDRVMSEVEHLLRLPDQRSLAVITHGGVMRIVLRELCGVDEKEAWDRTKPYCCFFRYAHGEGQ